MPDLSSYDWTNQFLTPALYVVASLVIGYLFHKVAGARLKKATKKTKWKVDDIIIDGVGKTIILWFFLAGLFAAVGKLGLSETNLSLIQKGLVLVAIASVAVVISRITNGFIETYASKENGAVPATSIFTVLTKAVIFALATLVVLQTFGISITPILTALGVGGLAVALALQETLSSLFAGLHLIASKKFKPGDFIEIESGEAGYIEDITWRNTTVRTLGGNIIAIPNANIANAIVTNFARPKEDLSLLVEVGVSYKSDLEKVEKVAIDVGKKILKSVEGGVADFEPFVRFKKFNESSIDFSVILRAKEYVDQFRLQHEYIKALHKRFQKEGIEMPFPQRDINIKNSSNFPSS